MKRIILSLVVIAVCNTIASAQGAVIAEQIRKYVNAEASEEKVAVKDASGKTHYVRSAATTETYHIGGQNTASNSVVFDAFNAHPEWVDMNVVVDWTGSMYSYVGQVVRWHHLNKDKQLINSMTLFNDGDDKIRQGPKIIGRTGGIYFPNHLDIDDFLKTVATAVDNGGGGDAAENDLEAIIAAQNRDQSNRPFVLIADATNIKDISLINQIKRPVHIIMCDRASTDYVHLARSTGGSITWPGGYTDYSGHCHHACVSPCTVRHVHHPCDIAHH